MQYPLPCSWHCLCIGNRKERYDAQVTVGFVLLVGARFDGRHISAPVVLFEVSSFLPHNGGSVGGHLACSRFDCCAVASVAVRQINMPQVSISIESASIQTVLCTQQSLQKLWARMRPAVCLTLKLHVRVT